MNSSPYHRELKTPTCELNDEQKRLQLHGAIAWENETRIDELFAVGKNFVSVPPSEYRSWFGEAVFMDCPISVLERLLAGGCDPNSPSQSPDQSRALGIAIRKERLDAIEWLLGNGADPKLGRPLVSAVNCKRPDLQLRVLRMLVDAGAEVNRTYALFGDETKRITALDMAKSSPTIKFLQQNGAKRMADL